MSETVTLAEIRADAKRSNDITLQNTPAQVSTPNTLEGSPTTQTFEVLEKWNRPNGNVFRIAATFLSFFILGMNDASPGALIPYLEAYYKLSYTVVSLIFLSPCAGYSLAAACNNTVHQRFGQRGIAIIAGCCHIITYLTFAFHPPWPVVVVFFVFSGFGNGLIDAGWCAWTGAMASANKVQGFMQSLYSLGATLAPLLITTMINKGGLPWYTWYYVMTATAGLELVLCTLAFWKKDGAAYRSQHEQGPVRNTTWTAIKHPVTLICGAFFLIYVGAEVALGGWIVTFMLRVRDASPYASGLSATGFWAGMTVGRASLGFVTERYGERLCITIYLIIAIALELLFWLIPKFVVSAVMVALLGFFFGPIFPGGVVMCAKLLPKYMHVSALGAATAVAGVGGAGIPFAVGAIAQQKGVWVLQPIVLALVVVLILLWLCLPRVQKKHE